MKVIKENVFTIPTNSFAVSASNEGYTLNYSVDGNTWTAWSEATPSNDVLVVNGVAKHMMFKLVGNDSTVYITY